MIFNLQKTRKKEKKNQLSFQSFFNLLYLGFLAIILLILSIWSLELTDPAIVCVVKVYRLICFILYCNVGLYFVFVDITGTLATTYLQINSNEIKKKQFKILIRRLVLIGSNLVLLVALYFILKSCPWLSSSFVTYCDEFPDSRKVHQEIQVTTVEKRPNSINKISNGIKRLSDIRIMPTTGQKTLYLTESPKLVEFPAYTEKILEKTVMWSPVTHEVVPLKHVDVSRVSKDINDWLLKFEPLKKPPEKIISVAEFWKNVKLPNLGLLSDIVLPVKEEKSIALLNTDIVIDEPFTEIDSSAPAPTSMMWDSVKQKWIPLKYFDITKDIVQPIWKWYHGIKDGIKGTQGLISFEDSTKMFTEEQKNEFRAIIDRGDTGILNYQEGVTILKETNAKIKQFIYLHQLYKTAYIFESKDKVFFTYFFAFQNFKESIRLVNQDYPATNKGAIEFGVNYLSSLYFLNFCQKIVHEVQGDPLISRESCTIRTAQELREGIQYITDSGNDFIKKKTMAQQASLMWGAVERDNFDSAYKASTDKVQFLQKQQMELRKEYFAKFYKQVRYDFPLIEELIMFETTAYKLNFCDKELQKFQKHAVDSQYLKVYDQFAYIDKAEVAVTKAAAAFADCQYNLQRNNLSRFEDNIDDNQIIDPTALKVAEAARKELEAANRFYDKVRTSPDLEHLMKAEKAQEDADDILNTARAEEEAFKHLHRRPLLWINNLMKTAVVYVNVLEKDHKKGPNVYMSELYLKNIINIISYVKMRTDIPQVETYLNILEGFVSRLEVIVEEAIIQEKAIINMEAVRQLATEGLLEATENPAIATNIKCQDKLDALVDYVHTYIEPLSKHSIRVGALIELSTSAQAHSEVVALTSQVTDALQLNIIELNYLRAEVDWRMTEVAEQLALDQLQAAIDLNLSMSELVSYDTQYQGKSITRINATIYRNKCLASLREYQATEFEL